jgi:hypothetical protein
MNLKWKGDKLARRITVMTANSYCLYHIHPEGALKLLQQGLVEPLVEKGKGINALMYLTLGDHATAKPKPAGSTTPASYRQTTVYKERLGDEHEYAGHWTYNLKPQHAPLQVLEVVEASA